MTQVLSNCRRFKRGERTRSIHENQTECKRANPLKQPRQMQRNTNQTKTKFSIKFIFPNGRVLLSLKFWSEQHPSDFQNIEVMSKLRFQLNLCTRDGMKNVENAGLFDSLLAKFGVSKTRKTQRMSVSVSIGTLKGLDRSEFRPRAPAVSHRSSAQNPDSPVPNDVPATVEKSGGSRRLRALSISNRFSLKKDPKDEVW